VSFDPCLEIEPGKFYSPAEGDRAVGLNIAVGDLDTPEKGIGNFGHFHHEEWFAGDPKRRTELREWGPLWLTRRAGNKKFTFNDTGRQKELLRD
jgi:hypothetical protein